MNIDSLNSKYRDSLFITSKTNKEILLKNSFKESKILNFKLVDIKEAESLLLPYIDPFCEYLIFKETNNKNLSKNIFNNLKYIKDKEYSSKKLKYIKSFFDDFKKNSLIKEKNIKKEFKKIISTEKNLNYLSNNIEYIDINNTNMSLKPLKVKKFSNIEEEISFVFNKISYLIDEGIDISLIKIYAPNRYKDTLYLFSKYFNIDLDINTSTSIKTIPYIKELLFFMKKNNTLNIFDFKDINKISNEVKNKILTIINSNIKNKDLNFILNKIEEININNLFLRNSLKVNDILNFDFNKNNFNFILGFDNINFIKIIKDDKYLNDSELKELELSTSVEKNLNNIEKINNILLFASNTNNLISFSNIVNSIETEVNQIIKDNISYEEESLLSNDVQYSYNYDKLLLRVEENKLLKYNYGSKNYNILDHNIKLFKESIEKDNLIWDKEYFKIQKSLSSTMLESYFKCPFSFYVKYVLNIKKVSKNIFNLDLGVYIHDLLEQMLLNKEKDISKVSEEIIKNNELFKNISSKKRDFIVFKVKNYLIELLQIINSQISREDFKVASLEEEISTLFEGYKLVGKIDKVLKHNNDFIVVDYKTGNSKLSFENIELGLNMQNLIYFILLESKYKEINFAGTYRYKVAPKIVDKESFKEPKREGYTRNDISLLKSMELDNYQNLKVSKGEYTKNSKVLSENEFKQKEEIVKNNIKKFICEIEECSNFKIQDLQVNGEKISCKYCDYNNICFKTKRDIIYK